jgi:nucleoid-associated protein YgaU
MVCYSIAGKLFQSRRVRFSVLLCVPLVFVGAARSSAQDLGTIARQAQAQKETRPFHANHVYTNDDLERLQILVPEDRSAAETARHKLTATTPEEPAVVEASAPEVSLGEIARQYQKQKLARKIQPLSAPRLVVATHVYSNDDLSRDKILTAEDTAIYKAALEKPVPAVSETVTEPPAEKAAALLSTSETPLGDLARAAYQRATQALTAQVASNFRIPRQWASFTSRVSRKHSVRSARRAERPARPSAPQVAGQPQPELRNVAVEVVTVRPGDSLWKLARRHLGRGVRWRALLAANPGIKDPQQLKVGTTIRV